MSNSVEDPMQHDGVVEQGSRVVRAPASVGPLGAPALLSVELHDEEEIRWHRTYYVDGCSMVTGFSIIKRGRVTGVRGAL